MESLMSGTMAGVGSFRCQQCGYVLTLAGSDLLMSCPGCGGDDFVRASLFATVLPRDVDTQTASDPKEHEAWLADARTRIEQPGDYVVFEDQGEMRLVALSSEWTRIGRSLAADIRFDDPTVSRRHALLERQPEGVRVLDDRSLNGVFVNGERVDSRRLEDEDEIVVGRYRLSFLRCLSVAGLHASPSGPLQTA
jgi:predicted  nucleic acid-binding Zn-ribbon protein